MSGAHILRGTTVAVVLALTGCGADAAPHALVVGDVIGRGLQEPWWTALPDVTDGAAAEIDGPIEIPADAVFASNSSEVRPADRPRLEEFAVELAPLLDDTTGDWFVVGATDTTGDDNVALGLARANSVAAILAEAGSFDRGRLLSASWGEECLAVDETTAADLAEARAANRRVVIVPPGAAPDCPIP